MESKPEMLNELAKMFRAQSPKFFFLGIKKRFPEPYGELLMQFGHLARELGSKAPIEVFRDAVTAYPESGLAWYALFHAITMCDDQSSAAATEALAKAAKHGCDYATVQNGKITVSANL
jgi:hypothetical protein